MKSNKNFLKRPFAIIASILSFIVVSTFITAIAQASDDPKNDNDKELEKGAKYSKFFDEKTHWCDALVINCSDFRFTTASQEFINERLGLKGNYDYISIPGSIRNLMDAKTRDLVLNKFGISVRLHLVKRIIILAHQDCSIGYGGSKNFPEPAVEYKTICKDLKKARRLMGIKFPHLKVYLYYATVVFKNKFLRLFAQALQPCPTSIYFLS